MRVADREVRSPRKHYRGHGGKNSPREDFNGGVIPQYQLADFEYYIEAEKGQDESRYPIGIEIKIEPGILVSCGYRPQAIHPHVLKACKDHVNHERFERARQFVTDCKNKKQDKNAIVQNGANPIQDRYDRAHPGILTSSI